jgi:hypothetical protein
MKNEAIKWSINDDVFKAWVTGHEKEFEPALEPVPTLKALIFLALLDKKRPLTYEELGKILQDKNVVNGNIPVASLRVALSEIGNMLSRSEHRLSVRAFKDGQREVKFELTPRSLGSNRNNRILFINEPTEKSKAIAEYLMEHQSLPLYSLYYLPRPACWWITFSSKEADDRKEYEGGAWDRLKLCDLIASSASSVAGIVGLAIGEGLGEVELLRRALDSGYTVHYLAVDLSPVLLTAHIETIRDVFDNELKEGRLFCVGVLVDVFSDLESALDQARTKFVANGIFMRKDEFIPPSAPVVASFLGNCMGNDVPDRENTIFSSVVKAFPDNRPLAVLAGVSVRRKNPEGEPIADIYTRSVDEFLLQTPHHLLSTIGIFCSEGDCEVSAGEAPLPHIPEFVLPNTPTDEQERIIKQRSPEVEPNLYYASHGIEGHIYRFYYRLDFGLEMPSKKLSLPAGTEIALYTVIKYDMNSLVSAIRKRRFEVNYDPGYHKVITQGDVVREYAVFLAYLNS